jgi:hypothetical protein
MGRGRRRRIQNAAAAHSASGASVSTLGHLFHLDYALPSPQANAAVGDLLERVLLPVEPDVDLDELEAEIAQGMELIATFYPEVRSEPVQARIRAAVDGVLAECGIGTA